MSANFGARLHRNAHYLLAALLLSLHLAIWWDFPGSYSRAVLMVHLGLFLLWQPLWLPQQRLSAAGLVGTIAGMLLFALWAGWVLLSAWIVLLIGLVAGTMVSGRERYVYLATLLQLLSELLLQCVPGMFDIPPMPASVLAVFRYGLLISPVIMALIGESGLKPRRWLSVDFFRGLTASLLAALLVMGSLLIMYQARIVYPDAVATMLFALAALLLSLSWLMSPRMGFGGLAQLWEQALLNIGTPFEAWLRNVARMAETEKTPEGFLASATHALVRLPWITGVSCALDGNIQEHGRHSPYALSLTIGELAFELYTDRPVGATLQLHCKLLIEVIGHFYTAKIREQELAQRAQLQAVYETGSRITHDIKNLLQSLKTLTSAVSEPNHADQAAGNELLRRQLPHITGRLELALDKLQEPGEPSANWIALGAWWQSLKGRLHLDYVHLEGDPTEEMFVPKELFDSVIDNLLDNLRQKRLLEPDVQARLVLRVRGAGCALTLCDDGSALSEGAEKQLFKAPVSSQTGLGIGLYHAARLADLHGYRLRLADNRPGHVCFKLSRSAEGVPSPPD